MADKSQKVAPNGYVPLEALCVELAAGGIEQDNIEHVRQETDFNGQGRKVRSVSPPPPPPLRFSCCPRL